MKKPTLFGAEYSVYVRIVRLVLEEVGAPHDLVEIDIFSEETLPGDYIARHPFGKIPAFEHEGFSLYESDAIAHYIVDAFEGAALIPKSPCDAARCRQIMRVMDNYGYPTLVWEVFVPETDAEDPMTIDPETGERAWSILQVLDDLMSGPFMLGNEISLADLWALPMIAYFDVAPSGRALLAGFPRLRDWLESMNQRPSVKATRFSREAKPTEESRA